MTFFKISCIHTMYFHIAHFPLLPTCRDTLIHLYPDFMSSFYYSIFINNYLLFLLLVVVIVVGCLQKTWTRPDSQNVNRNGIMATRTLYLKEYFLKVVIATLGCHFDYIWNYLKSKWLSTPAVREDFFLLFFVCLFVF